jgi:hypothetical protein
VRRVVVRASGHTIPIRVHVVGVVVKVVVQRAIVAVAAVLGVREAVAVVPLQGWLEVAAEQVRWEAEESSLETYAEVFV